VNLKSTPLVLASVKPAGRLYSYVENAEAASISSFWMKVRTKMEMKVCSFCIGAKTAKVQKGNNLKTQIAHCNNED